MVLRETKTRRCFLTLDRAAPRQGGHADVLPCSESKMHPRCWEAGGSGRLAFPPLLKPRPGEAGAQFRSTGQGPCSRPLTHHVRGPSQPGGSRIARPFADGKSSPREAKYLDQAHTVRPGTSTQPRQLGLRSAPLLCLVEGGLKEARSWEPQVSWAGRGCLVTVWLSSPCNIHPPDQGGPKSAEPPPFHVPSPLAFRPCELLILPEALVFRTVTPPGSHCVCAGVPVCNVSLETQPPGGQVQKGQRLALVCEVATGTGNITFLWYKGALGLSLETKTQRSLAAKFEIAAVGDSDTGKYYCSADNGYGPSLSELVSVAVRSKFPDPPAARELGSPFPRGRPEGVHRGRASVGWDCERPQCGDPL